MQQITAIIPTGNEEHNIEAAIDSVQFADEILVVDSFSTDKTVELAKAKNARIIQREYGNSASQKNWAIPQATHDWIILVDADERINERMQQEIKDTLKNPKHNAYWLKRQNYFMGQKLNYSGWQGDKVIRLFKRDSCSYQEKNVHSEVIVNGTTGQLKNKLDHYTYKDLEHYLEKSNRYSTWGAYDRIEKTKNVTAYHFIVKPFAGFFKKYIIQLGILDGKVGLIIAGQYASYLFIRALKMWRIQQGEKLKR